MVGWVVVVCAAAVADCPVRLMCALPEAGYTPQNLRVLIARLGWTQKQTAEYLAVGVNTVQMWLAETDKSSHRDMPLLQWRKLLAAQDAE